MANTYTAIKRDTTFPIEVGGNTLINLQKLLLYVIEGKTEEEITKAQDLILKNQYPEEWIEHFAFLSFFVRHLEVIAHSKGLTVQEELEAPTLEDGLPRG
mgnify:FL=1|jgi:hypothetical protein